jgi:hypothetical protein
LGGNTSRYNCGLNVVGTARVDVAVQPERAASATAHLCTGEIGVVFNVSETLILLFLNPSKSFTIAFIERETHRDGDKRRLLDMGKTVTNEAQSETTASKVIFFRCPYNNDIHKS